MAEEKLDRHTDPSGLLESLRAGSGGRPYLGNLADVDRILREFASDVITRFDEVGHGVLTPSDASAVVQQLGSVPVPTPPSATPTPVASPDHPQLLSIGEPVRADLPGGVSAVLTVSGPVTVAPPPGSTPPEPVQGTLTVTITSVSGTLTVHASDLTSRSEMGKTVPLSALGAADVTASPGHPATIQMRGIYTDGAAQITWASGGKAIAVWDFNIETD